MVKVFAAVTRAGWTMLTIGVGAYALGWRLGWTELMVTAAGVLVAFLVAVLFVLGRFNVSMQRTIAPDRVEVNAASFAKLTVENKLRPTPPATVRDQAGDESFTLSIPALVPKGRHEAVYALPTTRRGIVNVGPLVVSKSDPLGLLRREARQDEDRRLIVHPKTVQLPPLPAGLAKDLEGPTSEHNPKGDIAFHALRQYVRGDDHRHIHWKSSARTGSLMVRQYVDNRRPHVTVVLDTNPDHYYEETFELAVSATASFAVAAAASLQSTSIYVETESIPTAAHPARLTETLDHFAVVDHSQSSGSLARVAAAVLSQQSQTTTLVIVTGARPATDVIALDVAVRGAAHLLVVRAIDEADLAVPSLSRADVINAASLDAFRAGWIRVTQ